jgi:deoxyribodipyrimidine photolyase-related protein
VWKRKKIQTLLRILDKLYDLSIVGLMECNIMSSTRTLRLILGDQLNPEHSWFRDRRDDVVYVLMEMRQETDYVHHHAQKILCIFAAMRDFARHLGEQGHQVDYLTIDDCRNTQRLHSNLDALIALHSAQIFEYQEPDEWRLDQQLSSYLDGLSISAKACDSEHFYTKRDTAWSLFSESRRWLMERFYREMRVRHNILIDENKKPAGGQWNYDHENRKAWSGTPAVPQEHRTSHDHSALWQSIVESGVNSFGSPNASNIIWPLNRSEALDHLDTFIRQALPHFGDFQDAMSTQNPHLFHSRVSFALNVKMLNPREVVDRAQQAYLEGHAPLAAVEGFIRQILGWREYVRGVYWAHMPGYPLQNALGHELPLPHWFWDGKTKMRCLEFSIGQSLEQAHAHHIQRLMVIGNFALLAGLSPFEVHQWYLGVYIDAFEWVEAPNTVGMSQFADGGLMGTKPYVSSAAYIDRMSDYCKGCHYNKKERVGERACPFNALYWDFHERHRDKLEGNIRLAMPYRTLNAMEPEKLSALKVRAEYLRKHLNDL